MIYKISKILINDNCGFIKVLCFGFFFKKKNLKNFGFFKCSIKKTFKKYKKNIGKKKLSFLFKTKFKSLNIDKTSFNFFNNESVLLKKRLSILGKFSKGPILFNIKKKKLLISFIRKIYVKKN